MSWATVQQVQDITGKTDVTPEQLAVAQAVIELYVNRTPDADAAATTRDLEWLKRAVAWQTVWQRDQAGYETRSSVTDVQQDGLIVKYASRSALTVAPLAERAIKNLSWFGNRSIPTGLPPTAPISFINEASDTYGAWKPIGGG